MISAFARAALLLALVLLGSLSSNREAVAGAGASASGGG
jgi:hypothetical protein